MLTYTPKKGEEEDTLLGEVECDGKVLPGRLVDGRRPDLLVLAVDLVRVAGQAALAEDGAGLKVELVGRVVGRLMPGKLYVLENTSTKTEREITRYS